MKIEINSPNMMTWCNGEYGNISKRAILNAALEGKFGDFAGEADVARIKELTQDASNFADDQKQLLAIVGALGMITKAAVEETDGWGSLRSEMSLVFGLSLVGHARQTLVDGAHEAIIKADGRREDDHMDVIFDVDVLEATELTDGFLGKILRALGFVFIEGEDITEMPDIYDLFGHMAFRYATDPYSFREWGVACQVADLIGEDFISHMSAGSGGLSMDKIHEMLSHLNQVAEE